MPFISSQIIGTLLACLIAGGFIYGAGRVVNTAIEDAIVPGEDLEIVEVRHDDLTEIEMTPTVMVSPSSWMNEEKVELIVELPVVADSDPIINCEFPHTGTLRVRKSECDGKKVDCEVEPGKWQVVWKEDCDVLRAKEKRKTKQVAGATVSSGTKRGSDKLIDCVFDDSWGKSHEFKRITEANCAEYRRIWTGYSPAPVSSFPPTVPLKANCYVGGQTLPNLTTEECTKKMEEHKEHQKYIADLERQHRDACQQAYADWRGIRANFWATEGNNYSSSAEATRALFSMMQKYQAEMRVAGCTQTLSLF